MKGALIGFGTIAMGHLTAYEKVPDMTIAAIVDPTPERRTLAKSMYPTIGIYDSVDEAINEEGIDFIDICSPPYTHHDYILAGLASKKHVLCEKPLLLGVQDFQGLSALIAQSNCALYPSQNYKFAPILQKVKRAVESSCFGAIVSGHFRTIRSGHAIGVPEWQPHWRRDSAISGGGILFDHGPHSIYMACHLLNQLPYAVSCLMGNLLKNGFADTEDTVFMTLYFDDNVRFIIDLSWAGTFRHSYYAVYGSMENIIVENDQLCHTTQQAGCQRQLITSEFDDPSHKAWFIDMLSDFKGMIADQQRQELLLKEALLINLVIEQAYESAKSGGKIVELPYPVDKFL
jgi:predicted dehydrogenase